MNYANVTWGNSHRFPNYIGRSYPPLKDTDFTLAFYGSHNASFTIAKGGQILEVLEFERFINYKNAGAAQYKTPLQENIIPLVDGVQKYFENKYQAFTYKYVLYQNTSVIIDGIVVDVHNIFPTSHYIDCLHHYSHAAGCFYQSPFEAALTITSDGGGNDGVFNVFYCERGEEPKFITEYPLDLGFPYMSFGEYLGDIKRESTLADGNLVYSGKIMGLVSYGKVREEWVEPMKKYYLSLPSGETYADLIQLLGKQMGIVFDTENRLSGRTAYDVAATSQFVFETILFECIDQHVEGYPNLPLCFAGGCALNILANTAMSTRYGREVFVGPNPNDCGLSLGMMLSVLKPEQPFNATYSGPMLFDTQMLPYYIHERPYTLQNLNVEYLAEKIADGKIVGVARGRAEHGPRALGNRSILCNPAIADMKDILNKKIKNREWYRPFAPVVRIEDVSKYFEWDKECKWMSFAPMVREEYRNKLPSITHVDGTARVQTVRREDNPFLYDLITAVGNRTGYYVLLNTSFNVDGKPILSTIKDALTIFDNKEMDVLVIEDQLISK
jgi:carbamoyltransferase